MMKNSSDLLEQILTHGPSQSTVFLVLTAIKEEGRTSEVIQGCLKALAVYPDDIRLRKLLAESYGDMGFLGQAEAELARVTLEIDELTSTYKLLAQIYARQERFAESFESLKRYLALKPDDQEALDLLKRIKPAPAEVKPEEAPTAVAVEPEPEEGPREEEPVIKAVEPEPAPEELATGEGIDRAAEIQEEPEEAVVDLATPTLAEIYFNQGLIQEAIKTYEKILLNNPDDKASEQRLVELRASLESEEKPLPSEKDVARAKSEKTIAILENWLAKIQAEKNG